MDLWLRGGLKVPVTMASEVPWPDALATFTPFGYAAVAREAAIAPITPGGIGTLAITPSRVSPGVHGRSVMRLLTWLTVTTWAVYAAYPAFDAWWFLRFLLPSWPAMFIGTAALIIWLLDHRGARGRAWTIVVVIALSAYGLVVTAQRHVFERNEGERRYATIAQLVAAQTEPSAMIFASIHAGSLRYYAGRATVRFDLLDGSWLDRAAAWLLEHGRHPYVLIEDWEMPLFRQRFGAANTLGELRLAPVLAYKAYQIPGRVYLFDYAEQLGRRSNRPRFGIRSRDAPRLRIRQSFSASTSETNAERYPRRLRCRIRESAHRPSEVRVQIPVHTANGNSRKRVERLQGSRGHRRQDRSVDPLNVYAS
jgi:hypothetical protein